MAIRFPCNECDKNYSRKDHLHTHIKIIHEQLNNLFPCDKCNKKFPLKHHLQNHIKSIHDKIRDQCCEICDYKSSNKVELKQHIKNIHDKIRDQCCEICDYKSSDKRDLKQHIKNIHTKGKDCKCPTCEKVFASRSSMYRHFKTTHENITDFNCLECSYATGDLSHFQRHTKVCTGKFVGSAGEYIIFQLLTELKVDFLYDKSYRGIKDKALLRMDFVLYPDSENPAFLEYDGEFHFRAIRMGHQTEAQAEKAFENACRRDKIKDDYAEDNDICMMRIPYWDFKNIDNLVRDFVKNTNF